MRISIIGCGFGAALGVMWHSFKTAEITLYTKFQDEAEALMRDRENKRVLPEIKIPEEIKITYNPDDIKNSDYVVFTVPSPFLENSCVGLKDFISNNTVIISASKGFVEKDREPRRLSEIISRYFPNNKIAVISGPSHAEEVGSGVLTCAVCAELNTEKYPRDDEAKTIINELSTPNFRIYGSSDVIGVELGGAFKNPIALCAGIMKGYGESLLKSLIESGSEDVRIGDNTFAALLTRGIAEITRLGVALGADARTFAGLSGIGDLIVTCNSNLSRNRRAGILIGQGIPAAEAIRRIGTVEGYSALPAMKILAAKYNVSAPITDELYDVCFRGKLPSQAISALTDRPKKGEIL